MEHSPFPVMEDIFASLSDCRVFCVLDLAGAYQQLALSPEAQEALTINTTFGLFQYTRLPFGIKTAPQTFQSVMSQILFGLSNVFCYLDDILIGAATDNECKDSLMKVLSRLNEYNVKINLGKCKFLQREVAYLGHILCGGQIMPNPIKIEAVMKAPVPKNLAQLQSFLGLLNYYGRFIPNLSTKLSVLYGLLRKDNPYKWTEGCQKVFDNSKELLVNHKV